MRGLTVNRDVGINSTLPRVFGLEGLVGCSVGRVWCFSLATCISLRFPKVVLVQVFLHIMIFDGDTGAIFRFPKVSKSSRCLRLRFLQPRSARAPLDVTIVDPCQSLRTSIHSIVLWAITGLYLITGYIRIYSLP